ncbi:MAG: winged helix-turn-helix transcriptional regulator [Lachnospiraceae bacterium]|nr:winged helix-turn-helix transcriptional regulator [Lachnospiraceae bacterium]
MQLAATEMGIGNCWVQCRGRVSQQKKGEPIATTSEDIALVKRGAMQKMESLVAATIAKDKAFKHLFGQFMDGKVDGGNRVQFNEIPPHVEYSFTEKGRDLMPIFYAIMNWGFKYEADNQK